MKKLFAILAIALFCSACNTVSGFGRDVQKVGQGLEGAGKK